MSVVQIVKKRKGNAMRNALLLGTAFLVGLITAPPVARAKGKGCVVQSSLCDVYLHPRGVRTPNTHDVVCFSYAQERSDTVVLRAYDASGRELDAEDSRHRIENAPVRGRMCIGAQFVRDATEIDVCNSVSRRVMTSSQLVTLRRMRNTPPRNPVCLMREDQCVIRGYSDN